MGMLEMVFCKEILSCVLFIYECSTGLHLESFCLSGLTLLKLRPAYKLGDVATTYLWEGLLCDPVMNQFINLFVLLTLHFI